MISDFTDHADALEQACSDLIGINLEGLSVTPTPAGLSGQTITTADCTEVSEMIAAVELRSNSPCTFDEGMDPTPPVLCRYSNNTRVTNLPNNSEGLVPQSIASQDFDSGFGAWTTSFIAVKPETWDTRNWDIVTSAPDRDSPVAFGWQICARSDGFSGPDPSFGDCDSDLDNGQIILQSPVFTATQNSPSKV